MSKPPARWCQLSSYLDGDDSDQIQYDMIGVWLKSPHVLDWVIVSPCRVALDTLTAPPVTMNFRPTIYVSPPGTCHLVGHTHLCSRSIFAYSPSGVVLIIILIGCVTALGGIERSKSVIFTLQVSFFLHTVNCFPKHTISRYIYYLNLYYSRSWFHFS